MKTNILLLLSLCIVMFSCDKEPVPKVVEITPSLTLSQPDFTVSDAGGTKSISFESNVNWTAKSSESWCTVSPSSGGASIKSLTVNLAANDTFNARSCTVTVMAGGLTKTITVTQSDNLGLLVTKNKYELNNAATTIEVEVKANVDFDVTISGDWITKVATRGLTSTKLNFAIAKNEGYDNRAGSITIKQKGGAMTETITVIQNGKVINVIQVKTMGTLGALLGSDKASITEMKLTGQINRVDFEVMKNEMPNLTYIDLKDVTCDGNTIPFRALNGKSKIKTIILPSSITSIGVEAFDGCSGLSGSLTLPDGLEAINGAAFANCSGLTGTLVLPAELITTGNFAFLNCTGFTGDFNIPSKVSTIGQSAFQGCKGLTGLTFSTTGLTTIGIGAFSYCSGLTGSLTIPAGVTTIELEAFYYCTGFTGSLTFPTGLISIGNRAFGECSGFTGSLTLPDGVTTIGDQSFSKCHGFTGSLTLPAEVKNIGQNAFYECYGFTGSLVIPDGVTKIEGRVFYSCSGFTGLTLPTTGLTSIGEWAFGLSSGFTGTLTIPAGVTMIGSNAFYSCKGFTGLTFSTTVLTTIGNEAFRYCKEINGDVVFPSSLTSIGTLGFDYCNKVTAFQFPHTTPIAYSDKMLPVAATVKVPTGAGATYKTTAGWAVHKSNIVEY